jgi:putative redox protein
MAAKHEVIVTETGDGKFQNQVDMGEHSLRSDEPADLGGDGAGPDPYDLLLGALGACTSITLRMYADRKGWKLEKVRVGLTHQRIHAKDCEDCEGTGSTPFVDEIDREVEIVGDLDDEQRARLLEIANKCPVHRTLTENEIKVRTHSV